MTSERFKHLNIMGNPTVWDKQRKVNYIQYDEETTQELVDLLNSLDKRINELENMLDESECARLQAENELTAIRGLAGNDK